MILKTLSSELGTECFQAHSLVCCNWNVGSCLGDFYMSNLSPRQFYN